MATIEEQAATKGELYAVRDELLARMDAKFEVTATKVGLADMAGTLIDYMNAKFKQMEDRIFDRLLSEMDKRFERMNADIDERFERMTRQLLEAIARGPGVSY